jgi:hypothetical protein
MLVHHTALDTSLTWNLHAWQLLWDGNSVWDPTGTTNAGRVDFQFPNVPDPRWLQFMFRSTSGAAGQTVWESNDYVRQIVDPGAGLPRVTAAGASWG